MEVKRTWSANALGNLLPQVPAASKITKPKKKIYYLDPTSRYERLKATYPYLDKRAFHVTMENYEEFKDDYNLKTKEENKNIAIYNDDVAAFCKKNNYPPNFKKIIKNFRENHKKKKTRDYNTSVEQMNNKLNGMFIEKRKIQTIKDATTLVFKAFLYEYNKQFKKYNLTLKKCNQKPHKPVIKLDVNSGVIKALRNGRGGRVTNLSTQSIRNHRMRLEEAGVLVERTFHGYEKGVRVHINNQILVVFDDLHKKYTCFDNQEVKEKESEKLIVNNLITINKYNNKNNEKIRSSHALTTHLFSSTRTPSNKVGKKNHQARNFALNNLKNSKDFREFMMPVNVLATKLAQDEYVSAPEVPFQELAKEAKTGSLSRAEFATVLVNYFMMLASKIFKNRPASFGSWRIAIELWQQSRFTLNSGKLMHKDTMLSSFLAYQHGINEVLKFCQKHPEYRTLYPNQFFDMQRTDEKSGGFEYFAKLKWISYLEQQQRIKKATEKAKTEKENRLKRDNYNRLLEIKARKWLNGAITYENLLSYAAYNLPKQMQHDLPQLISNIKTQFDKENAA